MQTTETHYSLLGIPKDATEEEIKKAYRRISKVLHPDVSTLPDAQERFQNAKEAYEVLSDVKAREAYDKKLNGEVSAFGDSLFTHYDTKFNQFYTKAARKRPIHGEHMMARYTFTTADVLAGNRVTLEFESRDRCMSCEGQGEVPVKEASVCPTCSGKGFNIHTYSDPIGGKMSTTKPCEDCKASGKKSIETCGECLGAKRMMYQKVVSFNIPEDAYHGKVLRIREAGGIAFNGGVAGDILITLDRSSRDSAIVSENGTVYFHLIVEPLVLFKSKTIKLALPNGEVGEFPLPSNRPGAQIVLSLIHI